MLVVVDWIDEVSQNAQIQNYNLSISGNASDKVNYYLSAGYMKQDGLIVGDDYKKLTFMAKMDAKSYRLVDGRYARILL